MLPRLTAVGIELTNVDWVNDALEEDEVRRLIAVGRLIEDIQDSLTWMSLLLRTPQVGKASMLKFYDAACDGHMTFADLIAAERAVGFTILSGAARNRVTAAVDGIYATLALASLNGEYVGAVLDDRGWGGWLLDRGNRSALSDDAVRVFEEVGRVVVTSGEAVDIASFLNQLQPLA